VLPYWETIEEFATFGLLAWQLALYQLSYLAGAVLKLGIIAKNEVAPWKHENPQ